MFLKISLFLILVIFVSIGFAKETGKNQKISEKATCQEIQSWIQENPRKFPVNRNRLLSFPENWQRRIFAELSPETKSQIWDTKLAQALTSGLLNEEQSFIVGSILAEVNPALFQKPKINEKNSGITKIETITKYSLVAGILETRQLQQIVNSLENINSVRFFPVESNIPCKSSEKKEAPRACECSIISSYCSGICIDDNWTCVSTGLRQCTHSSWGCGSFWWYACNGMCGRF